MKQHIYCGGRVYSVAQAPIPTLPGPERKLWWCERCMSTVPDNEVAK